MADSPLIPISRLFRFACDEKVEKMAERPGGHHCESCRKTVVDMSVLTLEEAITTMRTAPPSTCVSYAYTDDGRLLFRSALRALGPVVLSVAAFLPACQPSAPEVDLDHDAMTNTPGPFEPAAPPSSPAPPSAPPAPDTRFVPPPDTRVAPTPKIAPPVEIDAPLERAEVFRTAGAAVSYPPPEHVKGGRIAPTWRGEAAPVSSTSDSGWPSATQTTVEPPRPPVIKPVPPRPIPPRLAGKPVHFAAGGMGDASQLDF